MSSGVTNWLFWRRRMPRPVTVVWVPLRASLPDTDAALSLMIIVVGVAASGARLPGAVAAGPAAV